ncbi:NAD-dependent methanol dehydrogenase [Phycisphaerae bacterium RAS2]|nr:NAD-dependent methanol dehydrogenase [Phycisphaerae bacterium RAS2]
MKQLGELVKWMIADLLQHSAVRVTFGAGTLHKLGEIAVELGGTRVLLVTDPGIRRAGHADRGAEILRDAGLEVTVFHDVHENPTTHVVDAGVRIARELGIDLIVGLGGGSSMDAAKGINFLLTNGGRMSDYWGVGKASQPMLPLVAVPTTAGTGSEAQSFALITDPDTHQKMACGDEKALPRAAILDPELTATAPHAVTAATGIDAVAHAVETAGCNRRNDLSRRMSREAWRLLDAAFETVMRAAGTNGGTIDGDPEIDTARQRMLFGAHLAGVAIEKSMLGAAHSCANPLTSEFGVVHGQAVGLMLPHVIRFNAADSANPYSDLCADAHILADRIDHLLAAAGLPRCLSQLDIPADALPRLAELAAQQWTARFNPRPVDADLLLSIYRAAL